MNVCVFVCMMVEARGQEFYNKKRVMYIGRVWRGERGGDPNQVNLTLKNYTAPFLQRLNFVRAKFVEKYIWAHLKKIHSKKRHGKIFLNFVYKPHISALEF